MKKIFHNLLVIFFLVAVSCSSREEAPPALAVRKMYSPEFSSAPAEANVDEMVAAGELSTAGAHNLLAGARFSQMQPDIIKSLQPPSRMLIKTATLNCEVAKYDEALAQIQKIAAQYGGYVVSSVTQVGDGDVKSGNVTLRIDAKSFEAALQELKKLARKIEQESVQGNDVTEEFYDLTARLENKRKAEKRYQEILASAKNTKDILEVERALTNVREEIERMAGRKRYLEDQVALSTINVNLHEPFPLVSSGQYGFLAKMRRGVELGISGFSDVLSASLTFVIAGLPIFILLFILFWFIKRYRRKSKAAAPAKNTMAEKIE